MINFQLNVTKSTKPKLRNSEISSLNGFSVQPNANQLVLPAILTKSDRIVSSQADSKQKNLRRSATRMKSEIIANEDRSPIINLKISPAVNESTKQKILHDQSVQKKRTRIASTDKKIFDEILSSIEVIEERINKGIKSGVHIDRDERWKNSDTIIGKN